MWGTQYLHSQVIEQNLPLSLTRAGSCLMWDTQYLHSTYTVLTFPSNKTESTPVTDTSRQLSDVGYTVLTQYLHFQVIEQNLPLSLTRAGSCLMWDTQYLHSTYTVLTFPSNRTESTPVTDTSRQLSDVGYTVLTQYLHSQVIEQNLPLSLTRAGSCLMWGTQYLHSTYISK